MAFDRRMFIKGAGSAALAAGALCVSSSEDSLWEV